jgi:hypothetical protein
MAPNTSEVECLLSMVVTNSSEKQATDQYQEDRREDDERILDDERQRVALIIKSFKIKFVHVRRPHDDRGNLMLQNEVVALGNSRCQRDETSASSVLRSEWITRSHQNQLEPLPWAEQCEDH